MALVRVVSSCLQRLVPTSKAILRDCDREFPLRAHFGRRWRGTGLRCKPTDFVKDCVLGIRCCFTGSYPADWSASVQLPNRFSYVPAEYAPTVSISVVVGERPNSSTRRSISANNCASEIRRLWLLLWPPSTSLVSKDSPQTSQVRSRLPVICTTRSARAPAPL